MNVSNLMLVGQHFMHSGTSMKIKRKAMIHPISDQAIWKLRIPNKIKASKSKKTMAKEENCVSHLNCRLPTPNVETRRAIPEELRRHTDNGGKAEPRCAREKEKGRWREEERSRSER